MKNQYLVVGLRQVDEDYLFQLKYDSFCNIDLICFYRPIIL